MFQHLKNLIAESKYLDIGRCVLRLFAAGWQNMAFGGTPPFPCIFWRGRRGWREIVSRGSLPSGFQASRGRCNAKSCSAAVNRSTGYWLVAIKGTHAHKLLLMQSTVCGALQFSVHQLSASHRRLGGFGNDLRHYASALLSWESRTRCLWLFVSPQDSLRWHDLPCRQSVVIVTNWHHEPPTQDKIPSFSSSFFPQSFFSALDFCAFSLWGKSHWKFKFATWLTTTSYFEEKKDTKTKNPSLSVKNGTKFTTKTMFVLDRRTRQNPFTDAVPAASSGALLVSAAHLLRLCGGREREIRVFNHVIFTSSEDNYAICAANPGLMSELDEDYG